MAFLKIKSKQKFPSAPFIKIKMNKVKMQVLSMIKFSKVQK